MFARVHEEAARPHRIVSGSTAISVGLHAAVLGAFALLGQTVSDIPRALADGITYFAPPPAAAAGPQTGQERITFASRAGESGDGLAEGDPNAFADGPQPGTGVQRGDDASGAANSPAEEAPLDAYAINADSVFLASQVDNPAAFDARSAAPAYPDSLRRAGVEGRVTVQFVVDTTGRVEVPSFVLLESSHGRFTESVRQVLPRLFFQPAEISGHKIRQLVQIPFVFRIQPSDTAGVLRSPPPSLPDTTNAGDR